MQPEDSINTSIAREMFHECVGILLQKYPVNLVMSGFTNMVNHPDQYTINWFFESIGFTETKEVDLVCMANMNALIKRREWIPFYSTLRILLRKLYNIV